MVYKQLFFSLVELSSLLNVDFSHVEHAAQQIVKSDRDTHLVLGNTGFLLCSTWTSVTWSMPRNRLSSLTGTLI
jgi:hypothetical protein